MKNNSDGIIVLDVSNLVIPTADGDRGMVSAAFHPQFPEKPFLFAYFTAMDNTDQGEGNYRRLARYKVDPNTLIADRSSEKILINQYDPALEHKGGTIRFGRDGYLYLGLGDGGIEFVRKNTQQITNGFFSSIIRLDIDELPQNLIPNPHPASIGSYRIPADNPYIGLTKFNGEKIDPNSIRTEFWAIGFRNPFRMTFDPDSNAIWVGDIGSNQYEELNYVTEGKNYGWPYFEGPKTQTIAGFSKKPKDVQLEAPAWHYEWGSGASIIVGEVYSGKAYPNLNGRLLVGDFFNGNIWGMNTDPNNLDPILIANVGLGITHYDTDPRDGGMLISSFHNWIMKRLVPIKIQHEPTQLLSQTGIFKNLKDLEPSEGIHPYKINVSSWSDNAIITRYVSLPEGKSIEFKTNKSWDFPTGTFWVQHFEIDAKRGSPASRVRLETRIMVKTDDGVVGSSYIWNSEQTDAKLADSTGLFKDIPIIDEHGKKRTQKWFFPGSASCMACHTNQSEYILGFNAGQLNRSYKNHSSQIDWLAQAGIFSEENLPDGDYPRLSPANDESVSLTHRVKSYLHVNCAHCHQPGGPAIGNWDGRIDTSIFTANILEGKPVRHLDNPNDRLIRLGDTKRSVLLQRIESEVGRMPPLGTYEKNEEAIKLITRWIEEDTIRLKEFEGNN
ncbi:PQQ-dependent sugar dehydrogenase [Puniceicoccaceae bacterium K14]|nr:PQQ-dependent sugar dehydrogenase [Puniceicoccaceae bacterium K14]